MALSLMPFYLQYEHGIVALIPLLTITSRVLILAQFVARHNLKEQGQKLLGIFANQHRRQTANNDRNDAARFHFCDALVFDHLAAKRTGI
jgi:hypothetical protein